MSRLKERLTGIKSCRRRDSNPATAEPAASPTTASAIRCRPPPLPLPGPGLIAAPAAGIRTMGDGLGDFGDGRAEPSPVTGGPQSMNAATAGTAQTPEQNRFGKTGKIGGNETMPPQRLPTTRTPARFDPGKIFPQARNLIDVGSNRQYQ